MGNNITTEIFYPAGDCNDMNWYVQMILQWSMRRGARHRNFKELYSHDFQDFVCKTFKQWGTPSHSRQRRNQSAPIGDFDFSNFFHVLLEDYTLTNTPEKKFFCKCILSVLIVFSYNLKSCFFLRNYVWKSLLKHYSSISEKDILPPPPQKKTFVWWNVIFIYKNYVTPKGAHAPQDRNQLKDKLEFW